MTPLILVPLLKNQCCKYYTLGSLHHEEIHMLQGQALARLDPGLGNILIHTHGDRESEN